MFQSLWKNFSAVFYWILQNFGQIPDTLRRKLWSNSGCRMLRDEKSGQIPDAGRSGTKNPVKFRTPNTPGRKKHQKHRNTIFYKYKFKIHSHEKNYYCFI
jgi:hypothetical protein